MRIESARYLVCGAGVGVWRSGIATLAEAVHELRLARRLGIEGRNIIGDGRLCIQSDGIELSEEQAERELERLATADDERRSNDALRGRIAELESLDCRSAKESNDLWYLRLRLETAEVQS